MTDLERIAAVAAQFSLGAPSEAKPWGSGHINDTYLATYGKGAKAARYIHQRINLSIFSDPERMMQNMERVTSHVARRSPKGISLSLARTKHGFSYWRDPKAGFWRTFNFIEGSLTIDTVERPEQAYESARAFGEFQLLVSDLPGPRLNEIVPGFHDTPARYAAFENALKADPLGRSAAARVEIEFALSRRPLAGKLIDLHRRGMLPERITHNDTKINNVLLDSKTGKAVCVIDLDTVMPGLSCYDFGDMVRASVSPAEEDERDLSRVRVRKEVFEALSRGYLSFAKTFLTSAEIDQLAFSGILITLETGVRFLTDHLLGDAYFKIHRPGHNLDRCRTQFRLVELLEREEDSLAGMIRGL